MPEDLDISAIGLRLLLSDGQWHSGAEVSRFGSAALYSVRNGLDGLKALKLVSQRRHVPHLTIWYRAPSFIPASVGAVIAAAMKAWRPVAKRVRHDDPKTCTICGESRPRDRFRTYFRGTSIWYWPACIDCEPEYSRRKTKAKADRQGRPYKSLPERRAAAKAKSDERTRRREEISERRSQPGYKQSLIKARKLKRKRMMARAYVEPVSLREVAERDGWRCAICGRRVSEKDWSLDHIVPLSKGGEHSYRNVALAHVRCNSARGAGRVPVQAPLFARIK